ncbi:BRD4-interacting chromatin-remodeling complex-associated protein [Fragariocoptes setiger]|uniref:BRD4-interacting chromatin-remodeling complex-associated protein n=1 Tax=Fragariocoptes setiger TaxID=1670756 RepID=A0ABQ7S9I1_9ACAR|nr:BRD4-interacting chromatin-remodeling complex-associated protein [Fragariocoptes setiger]
MDDGNRCLLDVINDPQLLQSFLESGDSVSSSTSTAAATTVTLTATTSTITHANANVNINNSSNNRASIASANVGAIVDRTTSAPVLDIRLSGPTDSNSDHNNLYQSNSTPNQQFQLDNDFCSNSVQTNDATYKQFNAINDPTSSDNSTTEFRDIQRPDPSTDQVAPSTSSYPSASGSQGCMIEQETASASSDAGSQPVSGASQLTLPVASMQSGPPTYQQGAFQDSQSIANQQSVTPTFTDSNAPNLSQAPRPPKPITVEVRHPTSKNAATPRPPSQPVKRAAKAPRSQARASRAKNPKTTPSPGVQPGNQQTFQTSPQTPQFSNGQLGSQQLLVQNSTPNQQQQQQQMLGPQNQRVIVNRALGPAMAMPGRQQFIQIQTQNGPMYLAIAPNPAMMSQQPQVNMQASSNIGMNGTQMVGNMQQRMPIIASQPMSIAQQMPAPPFNQQQQPRQVLVQSQQPIGSTQRQNSPGPNQQSHHNVRQPQTMQQQPMVMSPQNPGMIVNRTALGHTMAMPARQQFIQIQTQNGPMYLAIAPNPTIMSQQQQVNMQGSNMGMNGTQMVGNMQQRMPIITGQPMSMAQQMPATSFSQQQQQPRQVLVQSQQQIGSPQRQNSPGPNQQSHQPGRQPQMQQQQQQSQQQNQGQTSSTKPSLNLADLLLEHGILPETTPSTNRQQQMVENDQQASPVVNQNFTNQDKPNMPFMMPTDQPNYILSNQTNAPLAIQQPIRIAFGPDGSMILQPQIIGAMPHTGSPQFAPMQTFRPIMTPIISGQTISNSPTESGGSPAPSDSSSNKTPDTKPGTKSTTKPAPKRSRSKKTEVEKFPTLKTPKRRQQLQESQQQQQQLLLIQPQSQPQPTQHLLIQQPSQPQIQPLPQAPLSTMASLPPLPSLAPQSAQPLSESESQSQQQLHNSSLQIQSQPQSQPQSQTHPLSQPQVQQQSPLQQEPQHQEPQPVQVKQEHQQQDQLPEQQPEEPQQVLQQQLQQYIVPQSNLDSNTLSGNDFCKVDEIFELMAEELLRRKRKIFDRYRFIVLKQSMDIVPLSEQVMIEKIFVNDEKDLLGKERDLLARGEALDRPESEAKLAIESILDPTEQVMIDKILVNEEKDLLERERQLVARGEALARMPESEATLAIESILDPSEESETNE